MSTEKPPEPPREPSDNEADRLTYEVMRSDGKFVPQSPEEVARAEAEIDESAVALPPGLRDPLAILTRAPAPDGADQTSPPVTEQAPERAPNAPIEPSTARTGPDRTIQKENPMRGTRLRKMIAWLVVVGTVATVAGYQTLAWRSRAAEVRDAEALLQ